MLQHVQTVYGALKGGIDDRKIEQHESFVEAHQKFKPALNVVCELTQISKYLALFRQIEPASSCSLTKVLQGISSSPGPFKCIDGFGNLPWPPCLIGKLLDVVESSASKEIFPISDQHSKYSGDLQSSDSTNFVSSCNPELDDDPFTGMQDVDCLGNWSEGLNIVNLDFVSTRMGNELQGDLVGGGQYQLPKS